MVEAIANDLREWSDGRRWTGADLVIFGTTLREGEEYPFDDIEFWRELLGFPYVMEDLQPRAPGTVAGACRFPGRQS